MAHLSSTIPYSDTIYLKLHSPFHSLYSKLCNWKKDLITVSNLCLTYDTYLRQQNVSLPPNCWLICVSEHSLCGSYQTADKLNHSVDMGLVSIQHHIQYAIAYQNVIITVRLDLSAAFGTVDAVQAIT